MTNTSTHQQQPAFNTHQQQLATMKHDIMYSMKHYRQHAGKLCEELLVEAVEVDWHLQDLIHVGAHVGCSLAHAPYQHSST